MRIEECENHVVWTMKSEVEMRKNMTTKESSVCLDRERKMSVNSFLSQSQSYMEYTTEQGSVYPSI